MTDSTTEPTNTMTDQPKPRRFQFKIVPDDDRRPPEITAQIRALEAKKIELDKNSLTYREDKRDLNREIFRLAHVGVPQDLSWRNNDGRKPFLPKKQGIITVRLGDDQAAFCQRMSAKGNMSEGIRACIDFTMAARQLPPLPAELDGDDAS